MKTITFLRHSKSSWEYDVSDINRPLNEFGINKIKKVSNLSRDTFDEVEVLFSSPANRAIHTCIILANSCLLYTSPSPRDRSLSRMPSSA